MTYGPGAQRDAQSSIATKVIGQLCSLIIKLLLFASINQLRVSKPHEFSPLKRNERLVVSKF